MHLSNAWTCTPKRVNLYVDYTFISTGLEKALFPVLMLISWGLA